MKSSTSNLTSLRNNMETIMTNSSSTTLSNDNEINDLEGVNSFINNTQHLHHQIHLQHNNQEVNNDLEDIDSTDDLDDDEIDYKRNSNSTLSASNQANSSTSSGLTGGLFVEDDKRKRRAIANSNERRRMQSINAGFQTLKSLIPHSSGEKLSKACILQRSADFMQYLSNEKEKLNNKLQLAIKILESNGLLNQYQVQINSTIDSNNQYTSLTSSNSNSGSKSASCTKINKQTYYLSNMTNQQQQTADYSTAIIKSIQNDNDLLFKKASQESNLSSSVTNNNTKSSPLSPSSSISPQQTPSSLSSTTNNRKSTQISSLLNTLGSVSSSIVTAVPASNSSNLDISSTDDCKLKTTSTPTSVLGPSSSFTASSSSDTSSSCSSSSSSSSKLTNKISSNLISKIQTTADEILIKEEQPPTSHTRTISIVNTNQIIPTSITNRQLTDTTNIKPLQPILITNSSFNQNNLIQTSNLLISNANDTYSIYDASTANTNVLSLNPSCNIDDMKLNEHSSLLIATTAPTTNPDGTSLVSGEQFSEANVANLVLIGGDGTNNNTDLLKIITPIHLKEDKNSSKVHSNKLISSKLKQENTYHPNHYHHNHTSSHNQSIEIINMLNDLKTKNNLSSIDSSKLIQIDSKVSPTSHITSTTTNNKIKDIKPIILNKLINSDDKTISQFLNSKNKSVHSDDLIESFNEMDTSNVYDEGENRNFTESVFNLDSIQSDLTTTTNQIQIQTQNHSKNVKISKTIQNLINMSKNSNSLKQIESHNKDDFNKTTTTIIKSSRSNSIDQLIAAAAVTSACMSPLSPSHSPPMSSQASTITSPNNQISNQMVVNEQDETSSVSRKNLNTIVEAIFHVEGKLLEQLEETPLNEHVSPIKSNSNMTSSSTQQQKPPKKRKYTTEESININTQESSNAIKDDLTSLIPNKQAYSNQYISEYYSNTTAKTNHYENINKILNNNSNKSPVRLNQNDLILNQSLINNNKNEGNEIVN